MAEGPQMDGLDVVLLMVNLAEDLQTANLAEDLQMANLAEDLRMANLVEGLRMANLVEDLRVANLVEDPRMYSPDEVLLMRNLAGALLLDEVPSEEIHQIVCPSVLIPLDCR